VTTSLHVVPTVSTFPDSVQLWLYSRAKALIAALGARGIPLARSLEMADAILAQWRLETRSGQREWNNAVANIKAGGTQDAPPRLGWHGDAMWLTNSSDGRQLYRSYRTVADGVEDWVQLMEGRIDHDSAHEGTRYQDAWKYLVETGDGLGWYDRVTRAGFTPQTPELLRDYRGIFEALRNRR
jgi:flagellum-specific peptidoglycan hydrolase FlgJ